MKYIVTTLVTAVFLCGTLPISSLRADVGTAWTYQGELTKSDVLYTGTADFLFSLWAAETGGVRSSDTLTVTNMTVSSGRFAANLDFGYDPFSSGQNLWLEIAVRTPGGAGLYSKLGNRQAVTPAPYAIRTRGMFVSEEGNMGIGSTSPDLSLEVARTRNKTTRTGPLSTTMGVRHDNVTSLPTFTRETNWLYLRSSESGNEIVRNADSDLRFMREATIDNPNPVTQMTLTSTSKLLLGTTTEQAGLNFQVGNLFGINNLGRMGFESANPLAKIHFANDSDTTDCIRFPNGTVQNSAPFTFAGFISGPGGVPALNVTAFMAPPRTIVVQHQSQRVFVVANQQIELLCHSQSLVLYVGYRRLGETGFPTLVGQGMEIAFFDQDLSSSLPFNGVWLKAPFSVSAIIENLAPGTYQVGMVGRQDFPSGSGYGAGNGNVTAFVF